MAIPTAQQLVEMYKKQGPLTAQQITGTQSNQTPVTPTVPKININNAGTAMPSASALVDAYIAGGPLTAQQITGYQSLPTVPTNMGRTSSTPITPTTMTSIGTGTDNTMLKQLLDAMKPSTQETATRTRIDNLLSQQDNILASRDLGIQAVGEQPIATPFIAGQGKAIADRAAVQAGAIGAQLSPLQREMATLQAERQGNVDVTKTALQYQQQQESNNKPIEIDGQLVQRQPDGTYKSVFGSPTVKNQPASVQEYEYAKANGYTGSFNDYQNADANRKKSIAAAGVGTSGMTPSQINAFNSIVGKYNSSPLIAAADRTPVLENAINAINSNPGDAALQLNLAYAYIQALDTYQSAVREGELGLVNSIDSKVGQYAGFIQQITDGQIVRPEVAKQIASAASSILSTIKTAAGNKAQSYASQAQTVGLGDQWNQYVGGFTPSYGTASSGGSGGGSNPLGI